MIASSLAWRSSNALRSFADFLNFPFRQTPSPARFVLFSSHFAKVSPGWMIFSPDSPFQLFKSRNICRRRARAVVNTRPRADCSKSPAAWAARLNCSAMYSSSFSQSCRTARSSAVVARGFPINSSSAVAPSSRFPNPARRSSAQVYNPFLYPTFRLTLPASLRIPAQLSINSVAVSLPSRTACRVSRQVRRRPASSGAAVSIAARCASVSLFLATAREISCESSSPTLCFSSL